MDYKKAYYGILCDIDLAIAGSRYGHETRVVLGNIKSRAQKDTKTLLSEARENWKVGYAKKLLEFGVSEKCRAALEEEFPALKESEDERIRKWLIEEIKATHDYDSPTSRKCVDDALAYLERQKEQKPVQDKEEREYVRTLKSLIVDFLRDKECVNRGYYQDIYDWLDGRHIEQQPKQEWSEEDEKMFTDISWAIRYCGYDDKKKERLNDYFKTLYLRLRPQPHWKPSEEQMDALENAWLECDSKKTSIVLSSLMSDLQKLL